ncbi:MAG: hypothetical protein ACYCSI_02795 [Solirubrobacteraceae bacterium]
MWPSTLRLAVLATNTPDGSTGPSVVPASPSEASASTTSVAT